MGRPRDVNSRRSKAERRRAKRAEEAALNLGKRTEPNQRVLDRREAFAFVKAEKGGSIDQDIHDGIGQLCALGLLSGHGHEPQELRNAGREYADLYIERYDASATRTATFERHSRSSGGPPPRTAKDDRFDRMDEAMGRPSMERTSIRSLLTEHYGTDRKSAWVQNLINHELALRGTPDVLVDLYRLGHDRYMLGCAIRGLCQIYDASLAPRFARRAA